jgi:hypothetical protein
MWTLKESEETVLEGLAVKIVSYQVGSGFVTQIEARENGWLMARGVAHNSAESFWRALVSFSERALSVRRCELTVGG